MLIEWILYFFIYSFLGWVCECIYCGVPAKKFINRGFLAGPYCPIYGCGALAVIYTLTPFSDNVVILFGMGVIVTSALEYITSYMMEKLFHTKWWDYSKHPFNIHGRICLKNSVWIDGTSCILWCSSWYYGYRFFDTGYHTESCCGYHKRCLPI